MPNWNPGDLALCVRSDWRMRGGLPAPSWIDNPRVGGVYTVKAAISDSGITFLDLFGFEPVYVHTSFRRIAPLPEAERRVALEEMRVPEVVG